jgi:polyisoprenoid-binding protein YceI
MTVQDQVAARYELDPKVSQFSLQAFASGLTSSVAHSPKIAIRDWTGKASFAPNSLRDAKLKVAIRAASLDVLDEMRDSDRREIHRVMNDEVLETRNYPQILFTSSNITGERLNENLYRVNISGVLSLHGVSNEHSFFAQVAFGVDTFRAYGEFTLLQTDYGLGIASVAGGALRLQDEIKSTFYVVGRKQS